jgi:5-methylcytosine-specific restriction endonuclease McrA
MRRKEKTPKQLIEEEAVKVWGRIVLRKNNGRCLVCGKEAQHPHHFIFKSHSLKLKFDTKNGIPLCASCHYLIHSRQDGVTIGVIIMKKGQKWLDYLKIKKREKVTKTKIWLQTQLEQLKEEESQIGR